MVDRKALMTLVLAVNGVQNEKDANSPPKEFYIDDKAITGGNKTQRIVTYHVAADYDVPDTRDGFTRSKCIEAGLLTESQAERLDNQILITAAWDLYDRVVFGALEVPSSSDYGNLAGKMVLNAANLANKKTDASWKASDKESKKAKNTGFAKRDVISVQRQSANTLSSNLAGLADIFLSLSLANDAIVKQGRAYKISNGEDSQTVYDAHIGRIGVSTKDIRARHNVSIKEGLWGIKETPVPNTANASSAATITPTVPAAPIPETVEA